MLRQARIDMPGALHPLIVRGIERRRIFHDGLDWDDFLNRLGKVLADSQTACYAWAFMPNHVCKKFKISITSLIDRAFS
jgi:putative transposase